MADLPTGTVTFLFTDIEGSVKMWERDAPAMQVALARHDEILKQSIEERGGYIFKTVGDAFCAALPTASNALEATLAAQQALLGEGWKDTQPLKVRMALHTGAAEERDGDYFGPPVNRVERLLSIGHGGQVLISLPTSELVRDHLRAGVGLKDLGEWRLKDLFRPERIFQLTAPDLPFEFPPLRTLEGRTNNLPPQPTPLGTRAGGGGGYTAVVGFGDASAHPHRPRGHGQDAARPAGGCRPPRGVRGEHLCRLAGSPNRSVACDLGHSRSPWRVRSSGSTARGRYKGVPAREEGPLGSRQLRAGPGRSAARGAATLRLPRSQGLGNEPYSPRALRGEGEPGTSPLLARPRAAALFGAPHPIRGRTALYREGPGREARLLGNQRQCRDRSRNLRSPRRATFGHRACGGASEGTKSPEDAR